MQLLKQPEIISNKYSYPYSAVEAENPSRAGG